MNEIFGHDLLELLKEKQEIKDPKDNLVHIFFSE